MRAKIQIPFRDGQRHVKAGESIEVNQRAALFLFSSGYALPDDDEARQFCEKKGYAKGAHPAPAGA